MSPFEVNRLAVISIRTSHVTETVHFYRDVIGLASLAHHGHHPAFDLGNGLYLVIIESQEETAQPAKDPRFPVIAFAVADLDSAVARLQEHHVEMPWGIEANHQTRWVEFHDPGGNLIEFAQFNN